MPTYAHTISELYQAFDPDEPIWKGDPRYVDLSHARGDERFIERVVRRISLIRPGQFHYHLLTGHRGCGKSTELLSLKKVLENRNFLVAYVDAEETLEIADVVYLDVLVSVISAWTEIAKEKALPVKKELIEDLERWFQEVELIEQRWESSQFSSEGGSEMGAEIPLLARLFLQIRAQLQSGEIVRKEVRRKIERRLSDFQERANLLLDHIAFLARQKGYAGLVAIVDNLEKIPLKFEEREGNLTNHAAIFIEHADTLKSLHCHIVYTVPVSLLNDRNLGMAYPDLDMLPMVRVRTPQGEDDEEGMELLRQVVAKRMDSSNLFSQLEVLDVLIRLSGGVLRDLFRLILFAADYAPEDGKIEWSHVERAKRKLIREYDLLIHEDDLELLKRILDDPHPPASSRLARLMYNRLALPYFNGEHWIAVHPAVQEAPTLKTYLGKA